MKIPPYLDRDALPSYDCLTMKTLATITSKRQLTIPAEIFQTLNFKENSKVIIDVTETALIIRPAESFFESVAGSVSVPQSKKGIDADTAIQKAKRERFRGLKKAK